MQHSELTALIEALAARPKPTSEPILSKNFLNVMVMGVVGAAGALVWNTVVGTPENFGLLQQQTAEIRTTVLEMKSSLNDISQRLDNNTKATSDQQAELAGLKTTVGANTERLDRVEEELRDRGHR